MSFSSFKKMYKKISWFNLLFSVKKKTSPSLSYFSTLDVVIIQLVCVRIDSSIYAKQGREMWAFFLIL